MSETRSYQSPKRQAQAKATQLTILEAFAEQLLEPGRNTLSPSEAATTAGVSVRTVHTHFPNHESQIMGLAEFFDARLYPSGVAIASGPNDLPRYYHDVHTLALKNRLSWVLATNPILSGEVRQKRRAERLDAIRDAIASIGAPARETKDTTAMLLSLSGADASWPMYDLYGLPIKRIPSVIATTVELIVKQLEAHVRNESKRK